MLFLLIGAAIVFGLWYYYNSPHPVAPAEELSDIEKACINSGGDIANSLCCKSSDDFPNLCSIGACGCSPDNSHWVKICDCGEGKCFDGEKCIEIISFE